MKTIAFLAVVAMLLVDLFGPKSSVGGSMTLMMVMVLVMLAVGVQQAWERGRGPLGWIVNIVGSVVGGFVALMIFSVVIEAILAAIHFQGKLATSDHPMRYISALGMVLFAVLGSWITLQIIYWLPDRHARATLPTP